MSVRSYPLVVSIVGKSNSGKTTLIETLIPVLRQKGLKVGTIKHIEHGFTLDHEGKDSYKHKQAGAQTVALAAPDAFALIKRVTKKLTVADIVSNYMLDLDIVLTEGYKEENWPKIEVLAPTEAEILTSKNNLLAAVSWQKRTDMHLPVYSFDDCEQLAELILATKELKTDKKKEQIFD